MQQRVDQRAGMDACAGMHHHAGRLIDCDQVAIFVQHRKRNLFRRGMQRRRLGWFDVDFFTSANQVARPPGSAVHQHAAVPDPFLDTGAAEFGKALLEREVETLASVAGFCDDCTETCILLKWLSLSNPRLPW